MRSKSCSRGLLFYFAMLPMLLLAEPVHADVSGPAPSASATIEFRHSEDDVSIRVVIAIAFVTAIAIGAAAIVHYARKHGLPYRREGAAGTAVKTVQLRRITARLSIVTVVMSDSRTITFADNGQSLLLLASNEIAQRSRVDRGDS
jgi:hypothetical protein